MDLASALGLIILMDPMEPWLVEAISSPRVKLELPGAVHSVHTLGDLMHVYTREVHPPVMTQDLQL